MTLTRKPGIKPNDSVRGEFPEKLPAIPHDVKERFPSLAQTIEEANRWWFQLRQSLDRQRDELKELIDAAEEAGTASSDEIATFTAQLATLNTTIAGIQTQIQSLFDSIAALGDPSIPLAALSALLASHIAATSAHGTASPIVGETDVQSLENKSVGLANPGYGRFTSLMSKNTIPSGITVSIPADYNSVIAGPFTILGDLFVDGTLAVL